MIIPLKNDDLIKSVNNGEVKSQDVAFMTHQEFCPEKWEELLEFRYTKSWKTFLHKWYLGYYALENVKLS